MKAKINYQLELTRRLAELGQSGKTPRLLLQDCCAPCGSYVIGYLSEYFYVDCLFYNPNIYPHMEYDKRLAELRRLLGLMETKNPVAIVECEYGDDAFYEAALGLEHEPEGGARCTRCFYLRIGETARRAAEGGYDFFTTTLTVSPHKNAELLNAIGAELGDKHGVPFLHSDFKKRDGYKRSIELSAKYGLYRQNYCGCEFSMEKKNDDS